MDFEIGDAHSDEGKAMAKRMGWDMGPKHGLVMLNGDEEVGSLSGHGYGETHIRDVIKEGLK